jgi:uncharacterized protein
MLRANWSGKLPPSAKVVVVDAGPLIALARLALLGLPDRVLGTVLLTPTVLAECEARPDRGEGLAIRGALNQGLFQLADSPPLEHSWSIDAGEASAIALAVSRGAGVLIDDKAGRSVAAQFGCSIIGTAGVLVLAKRLGLVTAVGFLLHRLRESGYFLGDAVMADALRLANE